MAHEHENQWQSYVGVNYTLQATTDFVTWTTLVDKRPGDGTLQSHIDTLDGPRRFYRLLQEFSGKEPLYLLAIASWDGSGVTLEWNSIGPSPQSNLAFHALKNNAQVAVVPLADTSYLDTTVSSGQTYTYSLPIYAS